MSSIENSGIPSDIIEIRRSAYLKEDQYLEANQTSIDAPNQLRGSGPSAWTVCWTYSIDYDRSKVASSFLQNALESPSMQTPSPPKKPERKKFMQISDLERENSDLNTRTMRLNRTEGLSQLSPGVNAMFIRSDIDDLVDNRHQLPRFFFQKWLGIGRWQSNHALNCDEDEKMSVISVENKEYSLAEKIFAIFRMILLAPITLIALVVKVADYFICLKATWEPAKEYLAAPKLE